MKNDTDKRQKLMKKNRYNVEDQQVSNFVPF